VSRDFLGFENGKILHPFTRCTFAESSFIGAALKRRTGADQFVFKRAPELFGGST
jgi:hypothetical protein